MTTLTLDNQKLPLLPAGARRPPRRQSRVRMTLHAVRRALLLILLGVFLRI